MVFNAESFEEILSFAESLGWKEPELDEWDHNACDNLEYEALIFIRNSGYEIKNFYDHAY